MKILIAGGSGFIGTHLTEHLLQQGHQISWVSRSPKKTSYSSQAVYDWENLTTETIQSFDLIINLAGANIGEKRWSTQRKLEILDSRIQSTEKLAALCSKLGASSPRLFNASAIGIYSNPDNASEVFDDNTPINFQDYPHFLAEVARKWEQATWPARDAGVNVVNLRFGVVMDRRGGVFKKLAPPFYFGLGGPIGSGKQPFCWIALTDLLSAIDFLMLHPEITGPINLVAPTTPSQAELAAAIGQALHRPHFIRTPACLLKLAFGEMAEALLLNGQHVKPSKLIQHGFQFQYNTIEEWLNAELV